jgi:hypothetical protein
MCFNDNKKRKERIMKTIGIGAAVFTFMLVGTLAGSASAVEGTLVKDAATSDYCHMKFPAIRSRTLPTRDPQVKSNATGDVIDYYGDCSETPTSRDQVIEQKHDESFSFGRNYEDGD